MLVKNEKLYIVYCVVSRMNIYQWYYGTVQQYTMVYDILVDILLVCIPVVKFFKLSLIINRTYTIDCVCS